VIRQKNVQPMNFQVMKFLKNGAITVARHHIYKFGFTAKKLGSD
jgi:hypothetical protein